MNYSEGTDIREKCYDTVGDIFQHPAFIKALSKYKKDQKRCFPKADYKNKTEGDLLREIFTGLAPENASIFLTYLKKELFDKEEIEDIPFLTALILSVEMLKEDINGTPSSIQSIVSEKILNVIGSSGDIVISEDEAGNRTYADQGIKRLLDIGFPYITEKGDIVYYLHGGENGTVCVWNQLEADMVWIDRKGKVLNDEERKNINNLYQERCDRQAKKDEKRRMRKAKKRAEKSGITLVAEGEEESAKVEGKTKKSEGRIARRIQQSKFTVVDGGIK